MHIHKSDSGTWTRDECFDYKASVVTRARENYSTLTNEVICLWQASGHLVGLTWLVGATFELRSRLTTEGVRASYSDNQAARQTVLHILIERSTERLCTAALKLGFEYRKTPCPSMLSFSENLVAVMFTCYNVCRARTFNCTCLLEMSERKCQLTWVSTPGCSCSTY